MCACGNDRTGGVGGSRRGFVEFVLETLLVRYAQLGNPPCVTHENPEANTLAVRTCSRTNLQELAAGKAPVATTGVATHDRQQEAGEAVHVQLVQSRSGSGTAGAVGKFARGKGAHLSSWRLLITMMGV